MSTPEKQLNTQISELLNTACDPLLVIDSAQNVLWFNAEAASLLALKAQCQVKLGQLFPENEARQITKTQHFSVVELELKRKDGASLKQSAHTIDISAHDPSNHRLLICLKSASASHLALNKREELLSTVAHDLKNPLGAIFGFADALLDTSVNGNLTLKQQEVLSRIRSTALRCTDMVRNYQLLSALQEGMLKKASGTCNLNTIVRAVVDASWREGPNCPQLHLNLSSEELTLNAERIMIDRIVSNLFSNALRYTPLEGAISISTQKEGNSILFKINNTLSVIPAAELGRLFERNVRGSTSSGTSGSGLGLYIVKQIISLLGGEVQVSSTQTEGTTFSVRLPIGKRAEVFSFSE